MGEKVSVRVQSYPGDLLRRFGRGGGEERAEVEKGEPCEMELSLGLSLGGCFGAENRGTCLVRSSSIDTLSAFQLGNDDSPAAAPLVRACSLPAEAEEEQRKRKELQSSLKRLEAKKRNRYEKRSSEAKDGILDEELEDGPSPAAAWAKKAGAKVVLETGGSIGSQGSSTPASAILTADRSKGSISRNQTISLLTTTMLPEQSNPTTALVKKTTGRSNGAIKEVERDMMQEMPCVSTRGDGPNGRRIEGFLYKYRKGEDVRIVCVCHGRFFTPAEFVKHAGGGDVAHPLRHIVVNTSF